MGYFLRVFYFGLLISNSSLAADWTTCKELGFCGIRYSLPVFGPGPLTNIGSSSEANSNAIKHVAMATLIPVAGQAAFGNKGRLWAGLSWIGLSIAQEAFFHAPKNPSPGYPAEVRTDLITRIVPTVLVLSF